MRTLTQGRRLTLQLYPVVARFGAFEERPCILEGLASYQKLSNETTLAFAERQAPFLLLLLVLYLSRHASLRF